MIEFGLVHDRCQLLARMGMGKSPATLAIIDARMLASTVSKTLVLGPLRVARSTWPEEGQKWNEFSHLKINFVEWTEPERAFLTRFNELQRLELIDGDLPASDSTKAARKATEALRPAARDARLEVIDRFDIHTVHYDVIQQYVEILSGTKPFQMGVADEATRLKSFRLKQGGKRAQALSQIAFTMRYWLNLSGGIVPNGLANLWGPMWFVDRGRRLGLTYDAFESRWFGYQRAQQAVNAHKTKIARIAFPHAQQQIVDAVRDVSLAFNPKDWFNIKDPIVERVYVELPAEARKKYREMERDMFTSIGGHDIEAFAASGKVIKTMQLANGAIYTGSDEEIERGVSHWVPAHDEKLDALESIIEESDGEPIMVAYHFKPDLARLKKRFPKGRWIDTKKDEDDFKAGKIMLAFVHPQSIGHGIDGFQNVCHIIVFFALTFDLDPNDQLIERIGPMRQMQGGFDREVMVYQIVARGTIDEDIADRLIEKRHVQDVTMDSLAYKQEAP
jgi:hypothetical protein